MTDQELIKGCQAYNPQAQAALYQKYAAKLMGVCMRYGKNKQNAEDIFQEAFVKVFHSISCIRKKESLDAWIKKIVIHTAINHYHQNKKFQQNIGEEFLYDNDDNESYIHIFSKLSNDELIILINQLPDGYRMVFNLYVIEGYSHKEIAEMLGTNEANSKVQLHKAKKKLQKMIQYLYLIKDERGE